MLVDTSKMQQFVKKTQLFVRHRGIQGHSGTGGTHVPPVPRESLFPLLLCSVQINQLFARVCSMKQMQNQKKRLTLVGFPGRVICVVVILPFFFLRFLPWLGVHFGSPACSRRVSSRRPDFPNLTTQISPYENPSKTIDSGNFWSFASPDRVGAHDWPLEQVPDTPQP